MLCKSLNEYKEDIEYYRTVYGSPNKYLKPSCRKEKIK